MIHLEAKFTFVPYSEDFADALTYLLAETPFDNFINEGNTLLAYASFAGSQAPIEATRSEIDQLLENLPFACSVECELQEIPFKNWNEEWEQNYFKPIIIGDRCAIRSSFHTDIPPVTHDIIIDPKMAFGTGNHETTFLMISELLDLSLEGKSFLEMGCGTAVLAIMANKLGATPVVGIDIEEPAYENALENCKLNHTPSIDIRLGGAEQLRESDLFDLIFANINRNILLADICHYAPRLKSGGELFMSGFYVEDIPTIEAEANRHGLRLLYHKERNRWVATRFIKE